jgi:hypothetical protein
MVSIQLKSKSIRQDRHREDGAWRAAVLGTPVQTTYAARCAHMRDQTIMSIMQASGASNQLLNCE